MANGANLPPFRDPGRWSGPVPARLAGVPTGCSVPGAGALRDWWLALLTARAGCRGRRSFVICRSCRPRRIWPSVVCRLTRAEYPVVEAGVCGRALFTSWCNDAICRRRKKPRNALCVHPNASPYADKIDGDGPISCRVFGVRPPINRYGRLQDLYVRSLGQGAAGPVFRVKFTLSPQGGFIGEDSGVAIHSTG